jgi:hypothetical protein
MIRIDPRCLLQGSTALGAGTALVGGAVPAHFVILDLVAAAATGAASPADAMAEAETGAHRYYRV